MSSVGTVYYGDIPYYSNLQDSRLEAEDLTKGYSYSEEKSKQQDKSTPKNTEDQRKDESSDLSHNKTPQNEKARTPRQKFIVSLLPEYLAKKTQSHKQQITIYFFNSDKKISFQKDQLNKQFDNNKNITIRQLLPYVIKSYCRLVLNFQPIQVTQESFELKLASLQNHEDPIIDPFSHDLDIRHLYDADNLVLVRKPRSLQKIIDWINMFENKSELEIIEVLMPEKKQFTLQIQKHKTVNAIKQKIATFGTQLGKIVLLSYNSFKICDNKRKISDLDQKIFEVYRQKVLDYVDKPMNKNPGQNYTSIKFYEDLWSNSVKKEEELSQPVQFFVNQTTISGKLTLCLVRSELIQRYMGGIMSSFPFARIASLLQKSSQQRSRTLSIHTLIGIKNTPSQEVVLKFMYKNRYQMVSYKFEFKQKKESFLKILLKVGRIYDKKWDKIA